MQINATRLFTTNTPSFKYTIITEKDKINLFRNKTDMYTKKTNAEKKENNRMTTTLKACGWGGVGLALLYSAWCIKFKLTKFPKC